MGAESLGRGLPMTPLPPLQQMGFGTSRWRLQGNATSGLRAGGRGHHLFSCRATYQSEAAAQSLSVQSGYSTSHPNSCAAPIGERDAQCRASARHRLEIGRAYSGSDGGFGGSSIPHNPPQIMNGRNMNSGMARPPWSRKRTTQLRIHSSFERSDWRKSRHVAQRPPRRATATDRRPGDRGLRAA